MTERSFHATEYSSDDQELSLEQMKIAKWLRKLRFRKKSFGGVSEQDVWKKIGELNAMYEDALNAERIRFDTLIEHFKRSCAVTADRDGAATTNKKTTASIHSKQYIEESFTRQREDW